MSSKPRYLEVAVPLPIRSTFTYSVGAGVKTPAVGVRVLVPFGNRTLAGVVVEVHDRAPEREVKPVGSVLDGSPLLAGPMIELARWLADYYFCPPGEVFRVMLPPGLLTRKGLDGNLSKRPLWPARRQLAVVKIDAPKVPLTARQNEILERISGLGLPVLVVDFTRQAGCSPALLRSLAEKGALRLETVPLERSPWESPAPAGVTRHSLNPEQSRVLSKIQARLQTGDFHSLLIHGVTGSGKTEVYLNAIAATLSCGKSALMLVPEIGLTPQMSAAFRGWFGEQVAILHSKLSEGERFDQWSRIREGKSRVVVGTRSAVFAPLTGLGIIIVDEEHDNSYKQEEQPRYNGRDTALKRGQIEGALVVMGSATPQLEVCYQALERGRHEYETIESRILERPLPTVHIVDMRVEFQRLGRSNPFSELLEKRIEDRLRRGQQSLILLNRRGYSALVLCRSCGRAETCENCSITLTHHQDVSRLVCHYCGYARSIPRKCADCGKEFLYFVGDGTEKIQELLQRRHPSARVDRLDRDTTTRKGSVQRILRRFASAKTDILVGTQMIAKGHDFPGVTLVGVLAADQALRRPDFRAAERTFQLLTQVAGRAGRGDQPGDVIVQTLYPNHYSLKYACAQDYRLFYEKELQFRRDFRYPPFTALANLLVQGGDREETSRRVDSLMERLVHHRRQLSSERRLRILGPAPAALERLKGEFRFQILLKTTSRPEMHRVLARALDDLDPKQLRRVTIDIDPVNLL